MRSVMNPGAQPFDAGLSGIDALGREPGAHRDAVAGRVGEDLVELRRGRRPACSAITVASAVASICAA